MMTRAAISSLLLGVFLCQAQNLTDDQKLSDLRQLSALYAKQYGPYEWKRDTAGFDLLNLQPWLDKALKTKDDIEYLDVLVEYVASLNDAHDVVTFPFTFSASLGFSADIYDGKVLIDSISRSALPVATYPFRTGDELVSVDGVSVEDWIRRLSRYSIAANPRSTARAAAARIAVRSQSRIPWAYQIGDTAEVVVRRASGALETYTIPWTKTGVAITEMGPVPSPLERAAKARRDREEFLRREDSLEPWQKPLAYLMNASVPDDTLAVLSNGVRPIFALPAGFQTRMAGNASTDAFTSGWWTAGGLRIGFLRIPTMSPSLGTATALQQFEREIAWMEENTDGLVIDIMRNPGGSVLYVEQLCQRLIPYQFRSIGFELRATASDVAGFGATVQAARAAGLPDYLVAGYQARYNDVLAAYRQNRGRTGPISLTQPGLMLDPARVVYTKPLVVLVDEFSASGGDAFAATMQDNQRALLAGYRTMGAGGNVVDWDATSYTEASTRVTRSLMNRKTDITTAEYPAAPYVENIGVRPEIEIDYMTRANLMDSGRPFVEAFTAATVNYIQQQRGN
jgi:hypothetical protein